MTRSEHEFFERTVSELSDGERILIFGSSSLPPGRRSVDWRTRLVNWIMMCQIQSSEADGVLLYGIFFGILWFIVLRALSINAALLTILGVTYLVLFKKVYDISDKVPKPKLEKCTQPEVRLTLEVPTEYYAITNVRLLLITENGIQTVALRENLKIIHRFGERISITIGNAKPVRERSEITLFLIRRPQMDSAQNL